MMHAAADDVNKQCNDDDDDDEGGATVPPTTLPLSTTLSCFNNSIAISLQLYIAAGINSLTSGEKQGSRSKSDRVGNSDQTPFLE
jgi:hypothetical protein